MRGKRFFLTFFLVGLFPLIFSQTSVTGIYSDYSYQRTVGTVTTNYNVWQSSTTAINPVYPDRSHNLLAFVWNNVTYSTGVNDPLLSSFLSPTAYKPQNFQTLPITYIPEAANDTYIGVGNMYGGGPANIAPIPVVSNLPKYLVDGIHGLDLGTAIYNLPNLQQSKYSISNINPNSIGDGIPDILITQMGTLLAQQDKYKFVDTNGNTIGIERSVSLSGIVRSGIGDWKFYTSFNRPVPGYLSNLKGVRDIRLLAFDWSDFGLTAANISTITNFVQTLSGGSDTAFTAYNTNSITLLQSVLGTVFDDNDAGVPNGIGYANAVVTLSSGGKIIATQNTDANGNYNFANVAPGNYVVTLSIPTKYVLVGNSEGNLNNSIPVVLTSSSSANGVDFGINLPPSAVNDTGTGFKSTSLTIAITSNDTDPNSGAINSSTVNLIAPPTATSLIYSGTYLKGFTIIGQGDWLVDSSGILTFNPAMGFTGNTTDVNYNVKDMAGLVSNAATVSIFINPYCTKPPASKTGGIPTKFGITNLKKGESWPQNVPNGFVALESNSKGFTITRVQNTNLIKDPKEGMLVYDIDAKCVKLFNGVQWSCIQRDCNQ